MVQKFSKNSIKKLVKRVRYEFRLLIIYIRTKFVANPSDQLSNRFFLQILVPVDL